MGTIEPADARARLAPLTSALAVLVTFQPGEELARNLRALRTCVSDVLVIDNGSEDLAAIERATASAGCRLLANRANLGVAAALNQAAREARGREFRWLAMFDQDSLVPPDGLSGLLDVWERHPARDSIAVMAMSRRDRSTGRDYHHGTDVLEETGDWRSVRATITSGSLVRCDVFDHVGWFDEALFIDGVDHDFCLRCRRNGHLIVEGKRQVLEHAMGEVTRHRLFGRDIDCTNHSANRRYYITRNTLELCARHLFADYIWCARSVGHLVDSSLTTLVFEKGRTAKGLAMLQGVGDFILRRKGQRPRVRLPGRCAVGE